MMKYDELFCPVLNGLLAEDPDGDLAPAPDDLEYVPVGGSGTVYDQILSENIESPCPAHFSASATVRT